MKDSCLIHRGFVPQSIFLKGDFQARFNYKVVPRMFSV